MRRRVDRLSCNKKGLIGPALDIFAKCLFQARQLEPHRDAVLPPVIFLTGHGDIPTTVRAMRRGAEDFLTKRAPKEDLLAAVERALERDTHRRAERARLLQIRGCLDALTSREREVLNHVVKGHLNKQTPRSC